MFKNFDLKHGLAFAACIVILGVVQVPQIHPYATIVLGAALPLFAYAGMALPQLGAKKEDPS